MHHHGSWILIICLLLIQTSWYFVYGRHCIMMKRGLCSRFSKAVIPVVFLIPINLTYFNNFIKISSHTIWPFKTRFEWYWTSCVIQCKTSYDEIIQWKRFPRYWPFVRGIPQRPVTQSFDVFFDLRLNKRLSKPSRRWWFSTPSRTLWRHCNCKSRVISSWLWFWF